MNARGRQELIDRATKLGFEVDVWRPAGRRVFRIMSNDGQTKHFSNASEFLLFIEGIECGLAIARKAELRRINQ